MGDDLPAIPDRVDREKDVSAVLKDPHAFTASPDRDQMALVDAFAGGERDPHTGTFESTESRSTGHGRSPVAGNQ
jgi:hypothetical protein